MCASECTIHPDVKQRVLKAKDRDTVVTGYSTGHPVRALKNRFSRQLEELDRANKPDELDALGAGRLALAMRQGDCEQGSLMAGQCSAMVDSIQPAAEIIRELMDEAGSVFRALCDRVEVRST
jgi:enoyl-[acyl-carrier protein] reductase II